MNSKKNFSQFGGSLNISGPVKIGYFVSKTLNKKIIIIGDIHGGYDESCDTSDSQTITHYIDSIKTNYPIDIFIETDIPNYMFLHKKSDKYLKILKTKISPPKDHITDLINLSYNNYKLNPNKRFHFIDVRYDIIGQESFRNIYKLIEMIKNNTVEIPDQNFSTVVHELITDYVFAIFNIIRWADKPDFDNLQDIVPYYFFKEYEKLYKSNPKALDSMLKILEKNIRDFLDLYFDSVQHSDMDSVEHMYELGQVAGASITDFYAVARIMKSEQYNNCIIYSGLGHFSVLQSYLESIGFELVDEINSQDNKFRCAKNILDFNEFFSNPK